MSRLPSLEAAKRHAAIGDEIARERMEDVQAMAWVAEQEGCDLSLVEIASDGCPDAHREVWVRSPKTFSVLRRVRVRQVLALMEEGKD